ncbi:LysR family transcriptional regulator [Defluviitalea phaphyphila]|uniref:LysR family transcriptional regulator n=1 Tax=Defluviitalea phaphyphila TaxID=1473580 RepID=UPI0007301AAF|nr:LysR family transcriptional regulator [Defluviitalea phaphyphila]
MIDVKLNTFITLSQVKNYTRTAEILNLTQPAVSQHIKFLEEYYNAKLFKKNGREIELTDEGKILFKYAKEIKNLYRTVKTEIKNKSGVLKTYNIGATMTIGGYVLPEILAKHKKIYKNITLLLQVYNTKDIIEKLLNRKLDFAIVEGPFDKKKFNFKKFKEEELVLAVSSNHPFAKQKVVDIEDVIKGNLILRERGSGTRKILEDKLINMGYALKDIDNYMEIGSISAIKSLVEKNLGYTIISKETIKKELEMGSIKIVPIRDLHIVREFNFIYLKDKKEQFIDEFIRFCIKETIS